MFDSTIIEKNTSLEGKLPSAFTYPSIDDLRHQKQKTEVSNFDGTLKGSKRLENSYSRLLEDIYQAFNLAHHIFCDLDKTQLARAFLEASFLADIRIFGEELLPSVCVDPYCEFTFSHKSKAGYVDIGVRGVGELSYHVRNDIDPTQTQFDDHKWEDYKIPQKLFTALQALRKNL